MIVNQSRLSPIPAIGPIMPVLIARTASSLSLPPCSSIATLTPRIGAAMAGVVLKKPRCRVRATAISPSDL
jgi:hypothetical protein